MASRTSVITESAFNNPSFLHFLYLLRNLSSFISWNIRCILCLFPHYFKFHLQKMKNILSNKNPNSPTYCLLARNKHKRNSQKNEKKHVGLSKFQDITMYHKKMTHFYKSLHVHKDKKLTPLCYKTNLNISLLLLNYWFQTDEVKKTNKQTNT